MPPLPPRPGVPDVPDEATDGAVGAIGAVGGPMGGPGRELDAATATPNGGSSWAGGHCGDGGSGQPCPGNVINGDTVSTAAAASLSSGCSGSSGLTSAASPGSLAAACGRSRARRQANGG